VIEKPGTTAVWNMLCGGKREARDREITYITVAIAGVS
jgi:hypothetical protein